MRIGYFADGPWSHRALDKIIKTQGLEVVFIVARYDSADPILHDYAKRLQVPYLLHPNVNSHEFIEMIKGYCADILVSMSFNQILKANIIQLALKGFINCHAGALPFYRGRNILNWALINGEKSFGVTVHYVDEGIDTGDIILQKFSEIGPDDDYATLLDKAISLCADTLREALELISEGRSQRIKQTAIHPVGFYCGRRRDGDEWIDWGWPSERIHNFVRAITTPGPCARTHLGDKIIAIICTELVGDAPLYIGTPGEVVGRDEKGIVVKTGDTTLRVTQIAGVSDDGMLAGKRLPAHSIGTRLGVNPWERIVHLEKQLAKLERTIISNGRD